jgi:RNA 2',3'-cyclic 3'-phosphodiesterase
VTRAATVEGHDRLRLFCALRLPAATVDALAAWQPHLASARGIRAVARDNLHVTLAFLGSRPTGDAEAVVRELRAAALAAEPASFAVAGYRETRSVGMLVLRDDGVRAGALARDLHTRLERLGVYRPEAREWLPHLTVVRFRDRPRLRPELPELGTFSPSDAALYSSVLRPTGAQYEVLESVPVGGG